MAVLRNGSKCSHTTCMLRFFTASRLALNPNLFFEINSSETFEKHPLFAHYESKVPTAFNTSVIGLSSSLFPVNRTGPGLL
jgi:hypothetical protein